MPLPQMQEYGQASMHFLDRLFLGERCVARVPKLDPCRGPRQLPRRAAAGRFYLALDRVVNDAAGKFVAHAFEGRGEVDLVAGQLAVLDAPLLRARGKRALEYLETLLNGGIELDGFAVRL